MKIHKTTLRVVIYSEEPVRLEDGGLSDLAESIDTGDNIGGVDVTARETIEDPQQLRKELLEIGNDGEFFSFAEERE